MLFIIVIIKICNNIIIYINYAILNSQMSNYYHFNCFIEYYVFNYLIILVKLFNVVFYIYL